MVKKKCSVEAGVPSQVVTSTVLAKERGIMAIATKVLTSSTKRNLRGFKSDSYGQCR
jgi:hypothetical protein